MLQSSFGWRNYKISTNSHRINRGFNHRWTEQLLITLEHLFLLTYKLWRWHHLFFSCLIFILVFHQRFNLLLLIKLTVIKLIIAASWVHMSHIWLAFLPWTRLRESVLYRILAPTWLRKAFSQFRILFGMLRRIVFLLYFLCT